MTLQEIADRRNGHKHADADEALADKLAESGPLRCVPDDIPTLPQMQQPPQIDVVAIVKLIANALTNPNCRCWPDGNTFNVERVVKTDVKGQKVRETFTVAIQSATKHRFQLIELA